MKEIEKKIAFLGSDLVTEILDDSTVKDIPKETEILREGQYVKVLPLVINGLIKVFSRFKERELLLYYIKPNESCVMSLSASINNEPSKVFAITEEDTEVLLLPVNRISEWVKTFPKLNMLFLQQYNLRYLELLDTIHHVLISKMDERLYDYLVVKAKLKNQDTLKISHSKIAGDLGTAREVISRVMKKLEIEGKVKQLTNKIKIL